jgi:phosphate-selective porin OprO/OprP
MTLRKILLTGTALGAAAMLASPAFASSAAATQNEIDTLKTQMETLQQKLNDLQIQTANDIKDIKASGPTSDAYVTLKGHPTIAANDGSFTLSFNGRAHMDFATADTDDGLQKYNNGANFRRAEIGVSGKVMHDWKYAAAFQFGGSGSEGTPSLKEGYISYEGIDNLKLQVGAIALPLTLDYATSSNDITFIERAAAANMMIGLGSDDGRSAVGATYNNANFFGMLYYTKDKVGNSDPKSGGAESDNIVGRLAYAFHPGENTTIHLGASGTYGSHMQGNSLSLGDRPGIRVDSIKYIDTGTINDVESAKYYGPEAAFAVGPFRAQAEYYKYDIARKSGLSDISLDSWYVQTSWILTGESYKYKSSSASFGGVKPANPLGAGGTGAWEIAARYGSSDLNDLGAGINGGEEKLTTVGLNWYPNNSFRFMLNFIHGEESVNTGGGGTVTTDGDVNIVALRTQFAF